MKKNSAQPKPSSRQVDPAAHSQIRCPRCKAWLVNLTDFATCPDWQLCGSGLFKRLDRNDFSLIARDAFPAAREIVPRKGARPMTCKLGNRKGRYKRIGRSFGAAAAHRKGIVLKRIVGRVDGKYFEFVEHEEE